MVEKVRDGMRSFLQIQPPQIRSYNVWGQFDWSGNCIKNRLWYRGQESELEQFWKEVPGEANRLRFWAAVPTVGRDIEKLHVGLPALIADMLTDIVVSDLQAVDAGDGMDAEAWAEIAEENRFRDLMSEAVKEALVFGDGAFKISIDRELSPLPIIEFWGGDKVDFEYRRGRLVAVRFLSEVDGVDLEERYEVGRIANAATKGGNAAPLPDGVPEEVTWGGGFSMAVPLRFFPSKLFEGRGGSIFDGRGGSFDALDECWSQWMDALRKARTKEYVPETLLPRNPHTGQVLMPNSFDNAYIRTEDSMAEGVANRIEVVQPDVHHDSYAQTYANALDLCLMGLISPSTLGVDLKKLDNAEAQREKEKATLYTRNKIISVLQDAIPQLVEASVNAWRVSQGQSASDIEASVEFGEYANPSFESMVETVGKARVQGIMSIEACVEELYGDTRTTEWKEREASRIRAEHGMDQFAEPAVGLTFEEIAETE